MTANSLNFPLPSAKIVCVVSYTSCSFSLLWGSDKSTLPYAFIKPSLSSLQSVEFKPLAASAAILYGG